MWNAADFVPAIEPRLIEKRRAKLGQIVPIPENNVIWIQLEVEQTRLGRIAAFLYKSVPVFIELEDDAGQSFRYRIIPSMAGSGWLLNPELMNDDQLVRASHGAPLQRYRWLRIVVEPGGHRFFKSTVGITFSVLPDFVHLPLDASLQR